MSITSLAELLQPINYLRGYDFFRVLLNAFKKTAVRQL